MTYVEMLVSTIGGCLVSAALMVATGTLDARRGYCTVFAPLCALTGVLALLCAVALLVLLSPFIGIILLGGLGLGLLLLLGGLIGIWR